MAMFMEPSYNEIIKVPEGTKMEKVLMKQDREQHRLSPLEDRWKNGIL